MSDRAKRSTVEVLIVSYNTRVSLEQCLGSLEAHQPPGPLRLDVAVCDNASSDGSAEMVASRFPGTRLLRRSANLGFARANNLLAGSSTADYLLLLNPDTVLVEDVITPLLGVLGSDPRIAVVGPRLVFPDGGVQTSSEQFPDLAFEVARLLDGTRLGRRTRRWFDAEGRLWRTRQLALIDQRTPRDTDFLWATCWLLRRADVPGELFHPSFVTYDEDLDFCRRQRDAGRRVVYVPGVTLVHVGGQSSRPEVKRRLELRGRTRYYREHGGRARSLVFRSLIALFDQARRAKSVWLASSAGEAQRP